jgi:hypothetical protein
MIVAAHANDTVDQQKRMAVRQEPVDFCNVGDTNRFVAHQLSLWPRRSAAGVSQYSVLIEGRELRKTHMHSAGAGIELRVVSACRLAEPPWVGGELVSEPGRPTAIRVSQVPSLTAGRAKKLGDRPDC